MFDHVDDSQHTQNIQINKVIGEKKKCLSFYKRTHMGFLANPVFGRSVAYKTRIQVARLLSAFYTEYLKILHSWEAWVHPKQQAGVLPVGLKKEAGT